MPKRRRPTTAPMETRRAKAMRCGDDAASRRVFVEEGEEGAVAPEDSQMQRRNESARKDDKLDASSTMR
jgi:hypothetical protein